VPLRAIREVCIHTSAVARKHARPSVWVEMAQRSASSAYNSSRQRRRKGSTSCEPMIGSVAKGAVTQQTERPMNDRSGARGGPRLPIFHGSAMLKCSFGSSQAMR